MRGASLTLDLGNGTQVTVNGPKPSSYEVYRALDAALPRGFFARTLRRLLAAVAEDSSTLPAQRPAWDSRAGLFRTDQGKGQAPFRVPLASGRTAFIDPKNNRAWFAKEGASHALSTVKGPVTLIGTPAAFGPASRFFTWNELKALESRATGG